MSGGFGGGSAAGLCRGAIVLHHPPGGCGRRLLRASLARPCPAAGGGGLTSLTCALHGGQLGRGAGGAPRRGRQLIAFNRGRVRKGARVALPIPSHSACTQRAPLPPLCPGPGCRAAPPRRWSWRRSGGQDNWLPTSTKRFATR